VVYCKVDSEYFGSEKTMDICIVWKAAELHGCQLREVVYKYEN